MLNLLIGKSESNDVVINNSTVSRVHARLFVHDNGSVFIKDLKSTNGTFVNGNRLSLKSPSRILKHLDIVHFGDYEFNWHAEIKKQKNKKKVIENDIQEKINKLSDETKTVDANIEADDSKNSGKMLYWYIGLILIVALLVVAFFMINNDSKKIQGIWDSSKHDEITYYFLNNGDFKKDSSSFIQEGMYLVNSKEKLIEFTFNESDLPIFKNTINYSQTPHYRQPPKLEKKTRDQLDYGHIFTLKNTSDYKIKITDLSQHMYYSSFPESVACKVLIYKGSYLSGAKESPEYKGWMYIKRDGWELISEAKERINNSYFDHKNLNLYIGSGEYISVIILTNFFISFAEPDILSEEQWKSNGGVLIMENSRLLLDFDDLYYLPDRFRAWNGKITYGSMKKDLKMDFEFKNKNLILNERIFSIRK